MSRQWITSSWTRVAVIVLALFAMTLTTAASAQTEGDTKAAKAKPKKADDGDKAKASDGDEADAKDGDKDGDKARAKDGAKDGDAAKEPTPAVDRTLAPPAPNLLDAPKQTDLTLRPSKPIELAQEQPSSGWWWKLIACAIIICGAVFMWRRRALLQVVKQTHAMKILTRTAVGVRSELLIVNVDGQKLLLGVTPSTISRLAVLPDDDAAIAEAPPEPSQVLAPRPTTQEEMMDLEPGFERAILAAQRRLDRYTQSREIATEEDDEEEALLHESRSQPVVQQAPQPTRRKRAAGMRPRQDSQATGLSQIGRKLRNVR